MDGLLTVDEVAQILKVPKTWVYERTRLRGADRLPCVKLGKYVRFKPSAIEAFLNRTQRGNAVVSHSE